MSLPFTFSVSWRFLRVWQRNLVVYQKTWKINFVTPLLEPFLYLVAFGMGLSQLIETVPYQGRNLSYLVFIAPALLGVNMMNNAFFETTYASFVRMYYQKTFDAMMGTPLSLDEIIAAEIIWGATKSVIANIIMLGVISAFGLVEYPQGLFLIPLSLLGGLAFGAVGMVFTGIIPSIEMFNLPIFLFVTPMFLFSGTFFPLEQLPSWAQKLAFILPLTHLVDVTRRLCIGIPGPELFYGVAYLVGLFLCCFPLAVWVMRRRLIH
jgi:lipooligosaccharide transport system permease protein